MHRAIHVEKFGGSDNLKVVNTQMPSAPKDNEVMVEIKCSGVNPVDTYARDGNYGNYELPYTPGMDGAGIVKRLGSNVKRFKVGDAVYISCWQGRFGTMAENITLDAKFVFPFDNKKIGFAEAAALGIPYFTAYRAIYILGHGKPGKRVLVHGATGGAGQATVQLAVGGNMDVVGTAGTQKGMDAVTSNGATTVYNHRERGYLKKIETEEGGFDIIVEMLANVNLNHDLPLLKPGGVVVVVGCRGNATINPIAMQVKETSVVGCLVFTATDEQWAETGQAIEVAIKKGVVKPFIHKRYPLPEASRAHYDQMSGEPTLGKIIVDVVPSKLGGS